MAKCPQCKGEVSTPKKTWKMAGRPDKKGKRTTQVSFEDFLGCATRTTPITKPLGF